jgi:hypothetical protein
MADEVFCRECERELLGALIVTESIVDKYIYTVHQETTDCNWRLCRGCRDILCKACDDARRYYCCDEGFILSRERASAALKSRAGDTSDATRGPSKAPVQ